MWLCLDCHAVSLTPLASAAARILRPPGAPTVGAGLPPPGAAKRTGRTAPGRGVAAARCHTAGTRTRSSAPDLARRSDAQPTARAADTAAARSRDRPDASRSGFAGRQAAADVASASGDRAGLTAVAGGQGARGRSGLLAAHRGQQPFEVLTARAARTQVRGDAGV